MTKKKAIETAIDELEEMAKYLSKEIDPLKIIIGYAQLIVKACQIRLIITTPNLPDKIK